MPRSRRIPSNVAPVERVDRVHVGVVGLDRVNRSDATKSCSAFVAAAIASASRSTPTTSAHARLEQREAVPSPAERAVEHALGAAKQRRDLGDEDGRVVPAIQ